MKRTHKVNVGGFSFNIEDDAIKPLEAYLDSVRDAYHGVEDEKEITDDIEERIGELLVERTTAERVVSVNEVNAVKAVMGEFGKADESPAKEAPETQKSKKRLFRDIDNKVFGGVCSGLGAYFDCDTVIFRLIFVFLLLGGAIISEVVYIHWLSEICDSISAVAFLGYIVLWICVPAARTVEQKCQLSGRPVSAREFSASRSSRGAEAPRRKSGSGIGQILLVILGAIMIVNGLGALVSGACIDFIPHWVEKFVDDPDAIRVIGAVFSTQVIISAILTCALWGVWNIFVGVTLAFDLQAPRWRPGTILFIAFVLSGIVTMVLIFDACLDIPMLLNI